MKISLVVLSSVSFLCSTALLTLTLISLIRPRRRVRRFVKSA